VFNQLMIDSRVFRTFVMTNYGALISDLIVLLDEVAFHNLDARLAKLLLEAGTNSVKKTHQQMADELGTAREVISRQVKRFEQKQWVALGRGQLEVLDRAALTKLAQS
jgi:CRP/FNR family transcriptional regulator